MHYIRLIFNSIIFLLIRIINKEERQQQKDTGTKYHNKDQYSSFDWLALLFKNVHESKPTMTQNTENITINNIDSKMIKTPQESGIVKNKFHIHTQAISNTDITNNSNDDKVRKVYTSNVGDWSCSSPLSMVCEPRVSLAAGIICISIPPGTTDVYFLLGKERHITNWIEGSNKWSEFGGSLKDSSETLEECASREFVEETLGLVDISSSLDKGSSSSQYEHYDYHALKGMELNLCQQLTAKHKNYIIAIDRIVRCNNYSGRKVFKKRYYVMKVPWFPDVKHKYEKLRNILFRLQKKSKEYAKLKYDVLKQRSFTSIINTNNNSSISITTPVGLLIGESYDHHISTDNDDNEDDKLHGISKSVVTHIRVIRKVYDNNIMNTDNHNEENIDNKDCIGILGDGENKISVILEYWMVNTSTGDVYRETIQYNANITYILAIQAWNDLYTFYNSKIGREYKNHPAIMIETIFNHVIGIRIQDQFMEKRLIDWWSLTSLKKIVTNNTSTHKREKIRKNFKEPLGIAIKYIEEVLSDTNTNTFTNTNTNTDQTSLSIIS